MAQRPATASIVKQNMQPNDVKAFETQFREWVKTAHTLAMPDLIVDSVVMVEEILSTIEQWTPSAPALPTLFYCLADIFKQIPPPPLVYLWPSYMAAVIDAHDKGEPIPQIPPQIYPELRPLTRRLFKPAAANAAVNRAAGSQGKRKQVTPASGQNTVEYEGAQPKKRRVDVPVAGNGHNGRASGETQGMPSGGMDSDSGGERGDDEGDDEDEDEDEEEVRGPKVQREAVAGSSRPAATRASAAPRTTQQRLAQALTGQLHPVVEIRIPPKRVPVSAVYVRSDSDGEAKVTPAAPSKGHGQKPSQRPVAGMTEAELAASSWEAYCTGIGIRGNIRGKKPVIFDVTCDNCAEHQQLCWTLEHMSACMFCREKKTGCSNSIKNGGVVVETKGKVKESKPKGTQGKKTTATKVSQPVPATAKVVDPPAVTKPPAAKAPPPSTKTPQVREKTMAPVTTTSPIATISRPSSAAGELAAQAKSHAGLAEAPAQPTARATRSRASSRASRTSRTLNEPAEALEAPSKDPLVSAPAEPNEVRYPAPFSLQPAVQPTPAIPMGRPHQGPTSDIAARLEVAEAEIRRLTAQIQEQSNTSRHEVFEVLQRMWKSDQRAWKMDGKITELTNKVAGLASRLSTLERVSSLGSVMTASSPGTPLIGTWQAYGPMYDNAPAERQDPGCGSGPLATAAEHEAMVIDDAIETMKAQTASGNLADPQIPLDGPPLHPSSTMSGVEEALQSGTVDPNATLLAPGKAVNRESSSRAASSSAE